jgi:glycosyltransferase involved in cell wall biosynthesis
LRIAVVSTYVPFVKGGGRNIVEWLAEKLAIKQHEVEIVYIPSAEDPELLSTQIASIKELDLDAYELVICIRPQAHLVKHDNKVIWFIHHIRYFYDMWEKTISNQDPSAELLEIRKALILEDTQALSSAKKLFTNSIVVSNRVKRFNGLSSKVLYPPLLEPEIFLYSGSNNEIVYPARVEPHKRQHLLVGAMQYVKSDVTLRIIGESRNSLYTKEIRELIDTHSLGDRVNFKNRWVSEREKAEFINRSLAVAYLPEDEDSYGYPTLEAFHAEKAMITTLDSGGVLELVENGVNGIVTDATEVELAKAIDYLASNPSKARDMGRAGLTRINDMEISWDNVVDSLIS